MVLYWCCTDSVAEISALIQDDRQIALHETACDTGLLMRVIHEILHKDLIKPLKEVCMFGPIPSLV